MNLQVKPSLLPGTSLGWEKHASWWRLDPVPLGHSSARLQSALTALNPFEDTCVSCPVENATAGKRQLICWRRYRETRRGEDCEQILLLVKILSPVLVGDICLKIVETHTLTLLYTNTLCFSIYSGFHKMKSIFLCQTLLGPSSLH